VRFGDRASLALLHRRERSWFCRHGLRNTEDEDEELYLHPTDVPPLLLHTGSCSAVETIGHSIAKLFYIVVFASEGDTG
jgi:hypothetical protein